MTLRVDPAAPTPPFDQLRLQIIDQIRRGELPPSTRLPSVRRLAADLSLAPNTVARAYRELEAAGYVRTAGRNGTVVAAASAIPEEAERQARRLTEEYLAAMRTLGWGPVDIMGHIRQAALEGG